MKKYKKIEFEIKQRATRLLLNEWGKEDFEKAVKKRAKENGYNGDILVNYGGKYNDKR